MREYENISVEDLASLFSMSNLSEKWICNEAVFTLKDASIHDSMISMQKLLSILISINNANIRYWKFIFVNCTFDNVTFNFELTEGISFKCSSCALRNVIFINNGFGDLLNNMILEKCTASNISLFAKTLVKTITIAGSSINHMDLKDVQVKYLDITHVITGNNSIVESRISDMRFIDSRIYRCDVNYNDDIIFVPDIPKLCPEVGEFFGYKMAIAVHSKEGSSVKFCIVKLKIPANAKRSSAFSSKCRCSEAEVVDIYGVNGDDDIIAGMSHYDVLKAVEKMNRGELTNIADTRITSYRVGDVIKADSFDECRWNECSNGIHFFMNEEEAIKLANFYSRLANITVLDIVNQFHEAIDK